MTAPTRQTKNASIVKWDWRARYPIVKHHTSAGLEGNPKSAHPWTASCSCGWRMRGARNQWDAWGDARRHIVDAMGRNAFNDDRCEWCGRHGYLMFAEFGSDMVWADKDCHEFSRSFDRATRAPAFHFRDVARATRRHVRGSHDLTSKAGSYNPLCQLCWYAGAAERGLILARAEESLVAAIDASGRRSFDTAILLACDTGVGAMSLLSLLAFGRLPSIDQHFLSVDLIGHAFADSGVKRARLLELRTLLSWKHVIERESRHAKQGEAARCIRWARALLAWAKRLSASMEDL
jgi:hypothetical protein